MISLLKFNDLFQRENRYEEFEIPISEGQQTLQGQVSLK